MRIVRIARRASEALVVCRDELGRIRVRRLASRNAAQANVLDEPVLQGLVRALDTTLGCGRVRADDVDVELAHRAPELRVAVSGACVLGVDSEELL